MQNSRLLNAAAIAGCIFAASVLVASVLAADYPALDIVNNGLPLLCVGLIAVLILSIALRSAMLIVTSAGLLAVALAILIPNLAGAAPESAHDAQRFVRVASFNLWGKGDLHASKVEDFLKDSEADAVVLEEVRWKHEDFLKRLQATYPHQSGTHGLVILSKHPIVDKGRLDRPGEPYWRSLIVSWARLDVNGTE
ncbi:MAG: endonuclease/exonuclease/phosphatase family protein, partial [Pseudomonadota bacterium]